MHPDRFRRIKEHYMAAIDLDAAGRAAYLLALPVGDQELREDILDLLRETDSTTGIDLAPDAEAPRSTAGDGGRAVDWAPESIGPYRIVRPIGRGGMGAVFEAEQLSPKRKVALKILRAGMGDARFRERFRREAEILGRMQHEGIARIFEAGVWPSPFGDEPYIAMEYVEGEDLERYVRSRRLTTRAILELIRKTALGLAHAHRCGIVHRDLKPQNILVTSDGLPKILDFGISRIADVTKETGCGMTETGQILGTLLYMSPEQARGEEVDWRADVYALGAITYELLTERRPGELPRATIAETLRVILDDLPEPLDRLQPSIDPDVAIIVHHALEKDPRRRYEDAQAMADDIGRHLGHLPIQARPPSAAYLLRKFAARHRALCGGMAATFLALTGGIVSTMRQVRRTEGAKGDLEIAKQIADRRADEAFRAKVAAEEARAAAEDRLDEANAVRGVLEDMIQAARANSKGRDVKVIDALALAERYATERFVGRPNVEAAVRASIGRAYSQLGTYAAARRELSAAIELLEKRAVPGDVLLIDAQIGLAECEIYSGRFDEADDLLSDAVDSAKAGGPASAPRLAQALAALAKVRRNRGKLASAAATYTKAIEAVAAAFGEDSENVAISTNDYGLLLQDLGRYADAEATFRKSLALFMGKGAGRTANAAVTRANLGLVLTYLDRAEEALPLFAEAVEIGEKTFGPDHDMLARFKSNHALALSKLHRLDEAKRAALDAIEVLERSPEKSAFMRAAALSRLGAVRSEMGELAEAEKNLREAVALASDALGATHITALDARLHLTGVLTRAGRIEEAAREIAVLVDLAKKGLDPDRPETAQYLIEEGGVLRALGRRDEALAAFVEGAERFSKKFGDAHPATRNALGRVVEALKALGRDAEAEVYRKRL